MNIKKMRNIHLYLGCFFAPLLIFFIVTGCWQTFNLHHMHKDGYKPPKIVKSLSSVHMEQRWEEKVQSIPFRYLIVLMTIGFLITTILGILMAFKFTSAWVVWACLVFGTLVPCFLILMAGGR